MRAGKEDAETARNFLEELFGTMTGRKDADGSLRGQGRTTPLNRILLDASRLAQRRGNDELGTEHVLWSLLQVPNNEAAHLLLHCGVDKYTLLGNWSRGCPAARRAARFRRPIRRNFATPWSTPGALRKRTGCIRSARDICSWASWRWTAAWRTAFWRASTLRCRGSRR